MLGRHRQGDVVNASGRLVAQAAPGRSASGWAALVDTLHRARAAWGEKTIPNGSGAPDPASSPSTPPRAAAVGADARSGRTVDLAPLLRSR